MKSKKFAPFRLVALAKQTVVPSEAKQTAFFKSDAISIRQQHFAIKLSGPTSLTILLVLDFGPFFIPVSLEFSKNGFSFTKGKWDKKR